MVSGYAQSADGALIPSLQTSSEQEIISTAPSLAVLLVSVDAIENLAQGLCISEQLEDEAGLA